ncbi:MAG: hypothetical protein KF745_10500 [Phycisphaeraceae bacterium]|nr:hypothetical protein [Phycisphaeraceae bacterium]
MPPFHPLTPIAPCPTRPTRPRRIARSLAARAYIAIIGLAFAAAIGGASLQPRGLPDGPTWGRGNFQPTAANTVFATGDGCSLCHSASPSARALWSPTGDDVSPHGLWKATLMAHSAKDPYWRAQVAKETARNPAKAADLEALCLRCHAPMGHHTNLIAGQPPLRLADATSHPLYSDGVSCTVCHQAQPDGLGTEARFSGNLEIKPGRQIFGPYPDPGGQPMIVHSAFTPTHGEHIRSSALCASCHTLRTEHTGTRFPEQSPYLEWRNSIFSDEAQATADSRSCQECHMADVGPMRVARNPAGADFNLATRSPVRAHAFVGGNALMLDILRTNAADLGVTAPAADLERMARATRAQLSQRTATIELQNIRRETAPDGRRWLVFEALITNLTGHKFPTGYPARRAWVQAQVRDGRGTIFNSGDTDESGRLRNVADELAIPHYDVIDSPGQVAVYEMVAADPAGAPTTHLSEMATRLKDNRLLPAGYRPDGPHAEDTAPIGVQGDANFQGGSDRVTYRVPLADEAGGRLTIVASIWYQPIPPAWVAPLRSLTMNSPEAAAFVRMYDAAKPKPEQVAITVAFDHP